MRTNRSSADSPIEARERILVAAQSTFAEKGYDGATTREIASRAHVPLGLLRYYFGGKLKLWQAAVDRAFGTIRRERVKARRTQYTASDSNRDTTSVKFQVGFPKSPLFVDP